MKKRIIAGVFCALVIASVSAFALVGCNSNNATSSVVSSEAVKVDITKEILVGGWDYNIGKDYGAATQGDVSQAAPTTLTLFFTDDGRCFNMIGDIEFKYEIKDGKIVVSDYQTITKIKNVSFEYDGKNLYMTADVDGKQEKLKGVKEESPTPSSSTAASSAVVSSQSASSATSSTTSQASVLDNIVGTWTADIGEDYGAGTQGSESQAAPTTLTLFFRENGSCYNMIGDVEFQYKVEDGHIYVKDYKTTTKLQNVTLSVQDNQLYLNGELNGAAVSYKLVKENN